MVSKTYQVFPCIGCGKMLRRPHWRNFIVCPSCMARMVLLNTRVYRHSDFPLRAVDGILL